jgi:hypothetical protein
LEADHVVRGWKALILTVIAGALLVAGCSSGYHYVKSSEDKTYFKVPDRWAIFDEEAIIDRLGADLTESERQAELDGTWRVAFDAAPTPKIGHLGSPKAGHPSGLAVVHSLSFDAADAMSNSALRNYFFEVDAALENGTGEIVDYEELQLDGGFRGVRVVANLAVNGRTITIDQTALLDQATTKVYALFVSCSNICYDKYRGEIRGVVDSWTVRAK